MRADMTAAPRPTTLSRAATDLGPRRPSPQGQPRDEENWELRHGWEEEYNSEEYLNKLNAVSIGFNK